MTSKDLAVRNPEDNFALPALEMVAKDLAAIRAFQELIQSQLMEGHDFGVIPGTGGKLTLLKPGAEKITKLLGLAERYDIEASTEDWDKPLFRYLIRCRLVAIRTGQEITQGFGECNSMESKYRWRNQARVCPNCGKETIIKGKQEYGGGWLCFQKKGGCGAKWPNGAKEIEEQAVGRIPNDDIYSQVNIILKMAKKRALVDAALSVGRLSDLFTQDLEDLRGQGVEEETPKIAQDKPQARQGEASSSSAPTGAPEAAQPSAIPQSVGELLTRATMPKEKNGLGYKNRAEVFTKLGIQSAIEIASLAEAWEKLKT